VNFQAGFPRSL